MGGKGRAQGGGGKSQGQQTTPLTLEVIMGPLKGEVYTKKVPKVTVGRTKKTHLALRDGSVSQKHAEFRYDGAWNLVDVGSTNGTTVNGVSLEQDAMRQLQDGDNIQFGEETVVRVSFRDPSEESMTVEEYLRGVFDQLADKLRDQVDNKVGELNDVFESHKRKLLPYLQ